MKISRFLAASLIAMTVWITACTKAPEPAPASKSNAPTNPNIVHLDSALDQLLAPDAPIDKVVTGLKFLEGPLWRPSGNLWFSDLVGNILYQTSPDGMVKQLLNPAGDDRKDPPRGGYIGPNGMAVAPNLNVVLCQHGN